MTMRALLVADLIRDEGLALKPYVDSVGKTTIGVGRNLDDVGITEAEAISLLNYDIDRAISDAHRALPSFGDAPEPVQRALVNMAFNLGLPRLRGFKKMLKALEARDYETASHEALDSKWAEQVGERSARIARTIREA